MCSPTVGLVHPRDNMGSAVVKLQDVTKPIEFGSTVGLFPCRLYDLLEQTEQKGLESIISWTTNGRAFRVNNPTDLSSVLPFFFQQTKYRSFQRQLIHWSFHKIRCGADRGAFFHPFFVRGPETKKVLQTMTRGAFKSQSLVPEEITERTEATTGRFASRREESALSQHLKQSQKPLSGYSISTSNAPINQQSLFHEANRNIQVYSDDSSLESALSVGKLLLDCAIPLRYSESEDLKKIEPIKFERDLFYSAGEEEEGRVDFEGRHFFMVDLDIMF
jgi:hypothetical protein